MRSFWTGFEKRAGMFDFARKAGGTAAGVAETVAKPGVLDQLKKIVSNLEELTGKASRHVDEAKIKNVVDKAEKVVNNIEDFTDTAKLWIDPFAKTMTALGIAGTAATVPLAVSNVLSIPAKRRILKSEEDLKREQLAYYKRMNQRA